MHRFFLLLLLVGTTLACNELENLVNKERKKRGLRALHCDASMRWVAGKHLEDQEQGAAKNLALGPECNVHSWLVMSPCCYNDDHSNMQCMHNKPLVRIFFLFPLWKALGLGLERFHYQSWWAGLYSLPLSGVVWLGQEERFWNNCVALKRDDR